MTTQNPLTFQNDHLEVSLKKEQGCKIQLDVKISAEATKASYQKAVAAIRKDVSLPGFRKGKAPEAMILQKYESFIEKEWREILLNTGLDESINLVKIYPLNQNSIKAASLKSVSKENGTEATYQYESAPETPSILPETLSIPSVKLASVTEKEIQEMIEEFSLQHGQWTDIEDRPAQEGDFVMITIDDIGDSPKNLCSNTLFSLKKDKMGNWMHSLIIGMTPGQTAEGMSEKESEEECASCEDGSHQHPEFIPTHCRITLNTIREAKPHSLDDDLAKKLGAPSFEELLNRVKSSLEKRAENEQKNKKRQFIEEALFAQYPFDIPASLVQDEIKMLRKRIGDDLRANGVEESQIASETKKYEQEAAQKYIRDYKLYFLTQKFAKEHHIEVSSDEVTMEMMQQMLAGGKRPDESNFIEAQSQIRLQLLTVKSLDRMIEIAEKTHNAS